MGCGLRSFPFSYPGLPLGTSPKCISLSDLMIDKVRSRLASWKSNFFSKVGSLVLIKSILSGIPIYFFSISRSPGEVCNCLERLMCDFLWEGVDEGKGKEAHLVR